MPKRRMLLVTVILGLLAVCIPTTHADPGDQTPCRNDNAVTCGGVPNVESVDMGQLAGEMAAHPRPDLKPIPVDVKILYGRAYRKVLQETDIYDSPNGAVIGHIDAGLNFVNGGRAIDGWVQIGMNRWLPQDAVGPVNNSVSKFSGVALPNGLPAHAFGWIVTTTQPSRAPGAKPEPNTPPIKRYSLVNLFAVKNVDSWNWYLIGPDQWIHEKQIARLRPVQRPDDVNGKWFAVDLYEQTLTAYEGDKAVFATLVSSGLPRWPTAEGLHRIWDRQLIVTMTGGSGQPDFYNLPQVPWALYFNKHDQSIHGAYWHDGFGFRRSHGCVNLSMTDARWAFGWLSDEPNAYTYIYHSGEYRQGAVR
jgi:L,D-transpeptidase catalytic domain